MSQIVGNPSAGIGGIMLGLGTAQTGQVVILFGPGDPNSNSDPSVLSAAVGSLWLRTDGPDTGHCLYSRTNVDGNVWTAK